MSFYLYFRDPESPTEVYKINRLVWVFNSFVLFLWRSRLIPKWLVPHLRLRLYAKVNYFDLIRAHENSRLYSVERALWVLSLKVTKFFNYSKSVWKKMF